MQSETPWSAVGLQQPSLATNRTDIMVDRNSAVLERLLVNVVRARDGEGCFLSASACQQLRNYVSVIASLYNDVHFHSFEHASHVLLSANSLINEMLKENYTGEFDQTNTVERQRHSWKHFDTYGISSNPLWQFTLVFAALVHDVQHEGITNRQLVKEGHPLAIRYHDRSVLEQNSLSVSYQLLMQPEFDHFRSAIFSSPEERQAFRSLLIDLLMTTDIGSPEQTEVGKRKWQLAFAANPEDDHRERKRRLYEIQPRRHSCTGSAPLSGPSLPSQTTTTSTIKVPVHIIKENETDKYEHCNKRRLTEDRHYDNELTNGAVSTVTVLDSDVSNRSNLTTMSEPIRLAAPFRRRHSCLASIPFLLSLLPTEAGCKGVATLSHQSLSLGVQRTVDFNGRVFETFPPGDECKANVILMYFMQISDVAHTMQDFTTFVKWNRRLFDELWAAFRAGRGVDVTANWYLDQITFLDSYIIPLAQRIKNCGVLGQFGFELVQNAVRNRMRWTVEGQVHSRSFLKEAP